MDNKSTKQFFEKFYHLFHEEEDLITGRNEQDYSSLKEEIRSGIYETMNLSRPALILTPRKHWLSYTGIAAALLLMLSALLIFDQPFRNTQEAAVAKIKPGGNHAVLTLADGRQIELNELSDGKIADESGVEIVKTKDGQLTYMMPEHDVNDQVESPNNTISTPNGGQYHIVLPDGSEVMLNAASSLTFPAIFGTHSRVVTLKGEAFFDVEKDVTRPFKVVTGKHEVTVLGTHFNINAYDNESTIRTTLEEGSVRVSSGNNSGVLMPGEQLAVGKGADEYFEKREVNVDKYLAWKNGVFSFENDDVDAVMRQLARWYDVEIKYKGSMSGKAFTGELFRNSKLSTVLEILEINNLHCEVQGKTITVSQKT